MYKLAVALASAALLTAGCKPGTRVDYSQDTPPRTETAASNANAIPENTTAVNPVVPPNKDVPAKKSAVAQQSVQVQLTEYAINMPDALPAGALTLEIANAGKEDHGFMIRGAGYQTGLPEPLKRGDRRPLDVNLKPGTYTVWCPVDGHQGRGMQRSVVVK